MIWLQSLTCFALWVVYAVLQTRRSGQVRHWAFAMPRPRRGLTAAALFVIPSILLLGLLLLLVNAHGLTPAGLTPWAWLLVALGGLGYIHAQTLATALLVSLAYDAVTMSQSRPSETPNSQGNNTDEASSS